MTRPLADWNRILERLVAGDRVAFVEFNRLVTHFLVQMRAYDFRSEWEDLRQEVLLSVVANVRAGRLRDPQALVGYVRIITRNKFVDRLKHELRHRDREVLPWDEETARAAGAWGSEPARPETLREVWSAIRELPSEQQRILEGIYLEGRTYEEVSEVTGMPLGTLKRRLRESLTALRTRLGQATEDG